MLLSLHTGDRKLVKEAGLRKMESSGSKLSIMSKRWTAKAKQIPGATTKVKIGQKNPTRGLLKMEFSTLEEVLSNCRGIITTVNFQMFLLQALTIVRCISWRTRILSLKMAHWPCHQEFGFT